MDALLGSLFSKGLDVFGNMVNGRIQEIYNENYMDKYGSVAAQWDQLVKKGINPYALAGQSMSNSGSSGTSASFGTGSGFADSASSLANSTLNPIVAANVESGTAKNNADARNTNVEAQYNEKTLQDRIDMLANSKQLSDLELGIKAEYAGKYSEILSLNMEQIREGINKTKAEIDKIKEEKKKIDEEIKKLTQEIQNLKDEDRLIKARTRLTSLQSQSTELDNRIKTVEATNMEQYGVKGGTAAEAVFIAGCNGDDKTVDAYASIQGKLREAESEGSVAGSQKALNETNPVQLQQNELLQKRDSEIASVDKQIEDLRQQLHNAYYSTRKRELSDEISSLERKKERINRRYARKIRRTTKGVSTGLNIAGYGVNIGT